MEPLVWRRVTADMWFSSDGAYMIRYVEWIMGMRGPYMVRYQDKDLPGVWLPVDEESNGEQARRCAERHRWSLTHPATEEMYAGLGADHVKTFFFPISDGTDRAALTITNFGEQCVQFAVEGRVRERDDEAVITPYAAILLPRDEITPA